MDWETNVEFIFVFQWYSKENKVKLVVVEFTNYVIIWWDQLVIDMRCNGERPLTHERRWKKLWRRYLSLIIIIRNYKIDCNLYLGKLKVLDEYFKDMKITMIRDTISKDREATMTRFLNGLNRAIANVVEL